MNTLFRTLALTVLFFCIAVAPFCSFSQSDPLPITVFTAAHHIGFEDAFADRNCSSTAVGPHTLLTAAHCMMGTDKIKVDGLRTSILSTVYDGNDHVLLTVPLTFVTTVRVNERALLLFEHVRMWGWPGHAKNAVLREGRMTEFQFDKNVYLFQLPSFPGDSGSGLIADDGTLIAVLSTGDQSANSGAFRLAFTSAQLIAIR